MGVVGGEEEEAAPLAQQTLLQNERRLEQRAAPAAVAHGVHHRLDLDQVTLLLLGALLRRRR